MLPLALLLLLTLAGCSPLIQIEQPVRQDWVELQAGSSLGQTLMGRYQGLQGAAIFLKPGEGEGVLHLHLRASPGAQEDLATDSLPLSEIDTPAFYRFSFPAQPDSARKDYYLLLEIEGRGSLYAGAAEDGYLNGALYRDGEAQDSQLSFRLVYETRQAALGLLGEGLTWVAWLAAAVFLFVIPGWALFQYFWPGWEGLSWIEKLGLAGGLSLAVYPPLFLLTGLVGLRLGALYAWLPGLVGLAALIVRLAAVRRAAPVRPDATPGGRLFSLPIPFPNLSWADAGLLLAIALSFAARFWVVRTLDLPMFGDSYHHSVIAQLFVDHGGLFSSWQPYADMNTFTYHFGLHTLVAAFHWVTRLPVPQSTLWLGQILNGMAVLALAPLALRLSGNRWAAAGAVLVAGLLVPMPMYYVNWGRYTQLAGQAILPAAVWAAWSLAEAREKRWGPVALTALVFAGLALTHYRVLVFALVFLLAFLALCVRRTNLLSFVKRFFWVGLGAGLVFLPWFLRVFGGKIMTIFASQVNAPAAASGAVAAADPGLGNLFFYLPPGIWLLTFLALGWGLWRRSRGAALTGLWWFLLLLVANPNWLHLPGQGAVDSFSVLMAAYIPAGILLGGASGWAAEAIAASTSQWSMRRPKDLPRSLLPALVSAIFMVTAGLSLWGARQRLADVHPAEFAMALRPDLRAAAWIRQNTPEDSRFLVNSFPAFQDYVIVGSDGGWWLPLLAGRATTLPPITYGFEADPWPEYRTWTNELTFEILEKEAWHRDVVQMLNDREVDYVYIGQQQGRVNYAGPVLEPEELLASPDFTPVYHQDRVWIFRLQP